MARCLVATVDDVIQLERVQLRKGRAHPGTSWFALVLVHKLAVLKLIIVVLVLKGLGLGAHLLLLLRASGVLEVIVAPEPACATSAAE
ncbi:hypothetical protein TSOC_007666 [Tetrabaena socialis]|uniref:Uncharacterized protein n=1 Tax=Tetrabaena socialis TaxID=47790 RepID=A0A2J8A0E7_9CHLO|nr:hypothetical protein TSOC_007666 [Tetrabaena socialis]|eukprot:PNH06001.1 hypothetical protein TSOC_007666 [Tetrabaena socialis]